MPEPPVTLSSAEVGLTGSRSSMRWSFARNWAQQGINAAFTFMLAALLGPEAFGVAAVASIFIMFSHLLVEHGLIVPLIQVRNLSRFHKDSAFWGIAFWSIAMALGVAVLSGWWGRLNGDPVVADVVLALTPLLIVQGLGILPKSQLMRSMDFRRLTLTVAASSTLGGLAGVYYALNDGGVWSLVVFQWISQVTGLFLLWCFSDYAPGLSLSMRALRELLRTGNGAFINQLGGFATARADSILVGLFFGPVAVGLYRLADRLVQLLTTLLARSISGFALPFLSLSQSDPEAFRRGTRDCLELSCLLSIPALALLATLSPVIVQALGDEWTLAWVAVSCLSVVGAVQSITLMSPQMLNAAGRTHLAAAISWISAGFESLCFVGVALIFKDETLFVQIAAISGSRALISVLIALPFHLFLVRYIAGVPALEVARLLLAPLACAGFGAGMAYALILTAPLAGASPIVQLLVYGSVSAVGTLAAMILLNSKLRQEFRVLENLPGLRKGLTGKQT